MAESQGLLTSAKHYSTSYSATSLLFLRILRNRFQLVVEPGFSSPYSI